MTVQMCLRSSWTFVNITFSTRPHQESSLRIIVATILVWGLIALMSGVIHLGPIEDTENYIQEIGTVGRDGNPSFATLLFRKKYAKHADSSMLEHCYNQNSVGEICCTMTLMTTVAVKFLTLCQCCDVCVVVCECSKCTLNSPTKVKLV